MADEPAVVTPIESDEASALAAATVERPTWVRYRVLGFLAAMTFVLYLDRVCIGQAAPQIQQDLNISETAWGHVVAAFTLSYALFEIPTGRWGDRFGSRGVLTRIVVWWSFFTALTGVASGLTMLLAVRFLFGAGEAGALPNSARVLRRGFPNHRAAGAGDCHYGDDDRRGRRARCFAMVDQRHWLAVVVRGLWRTGRDLGDFVLSLVPRRSRRSIAQSTTLSCDLIAGEVKLSKPAHDDDDTHAALVTGNGYAHGAIPWHRCFRCANVWLLGGAMMTMSAVYYMLISWYPKYLQAARGATANQSSWLASLVLGLGAFGCLFGGWLTDWLVRTTGNRRWGGLARRSWGRAGQHLHSGECSNEFHVSLCGLRRTGMSGHPDSASGLVGVCDARQRQAPGGVVRDDEHDGCCRGHSLSALFWLFR